ncbi:chemotaxis protein CheW [Lysobacter korlensis]|uniref:Chemotaxis protein CheW n=1 Tax=Lysobacter korlensis TaxID=553636 RepID=A0ABV6RM45_9GAMM
MNQPLIDAYLDELLGPTPGGGRASAPVPASTPDDVVAHAAVAEAVADATADALAVALLEDFDRETTGAAAPASPAPVCSDPDPAASDSAASDSVASNPTDSEASAPAPAPSPAAAVIDDSLAAELLAEFDREIATQPAVIPRAARTPAASAEPPAQLAPAAAARVAPESFELPESFSPVPRPRPVQETPPALRAKDTTRPGHAHPGRWLRVCVDTDRYAVELLRVQEVVRLVPIVWMRGAHAAVLGVMNLRGRIVPVFDLGLWLGTTAVEPDERARIVVVERNDELIGLLVTAVNDVVTLTAEHIEPPLGAGTPGAIMGVARANDAPTVLLDANWLFD